MSPLKQLITILLFLTVFLFNSTESSTSKDSTNTASQTVKNSTNYTKTTESAKPVSKEMEPNIFIRYGDIIGAIIGSFGAFAVALFILLKTRKDEKSKGEDIYCGLLFSVYADFVNHKIAFSNLKKELQEIERITIDRGKIILDSTPTKLRISFIEACRIEVLRYERFNSNILAIISGYITSIETLNSDLNFQAIKSLQDHFDNKTVFVEGVRQYFNRLTDHIDRLMAGQENLKKLIINEIKRHPRCNFCIDEETNLLKSKYI